MQYQTRHEKAYPGTGEHLQRDAGRARHWIFGLIVAAILLMLFAKSPGADWLVYELAGFYSRDRGEMLSNKQWDDLHNNPKVKSRSQGELPK